MGYVEAVLNFQTRNNNMLDVLENKGMNFHCDIDNVRVVKNIKSSAKAICNKYGRKASTYGGSSERFHIAWSFRTEKERDSFASKLSKDGYEVGSFFAERY